MAQSVVTDILISPMNMNQGQNVETNALLDALINQIKEAAKKRWENNENLHKKALPQPLVNSWINVREVRQLNNNFN